MTGFDREALIAEFVAFDDSRNEGRAYSDQKTSSALAWGESYYLNAYIKMYRVTGDARWLDKVVDHFDRMAANMGDHDGDGIPGWQADRYSVSRMRARELHNRGTARILPGEARVTNIQQAHEAVDAEYVVERTGDDRFTVRQRSGGAREVVHDGPHVVGEPIPGIAGFEVRLEGRPEIGDRFRVETWGPAPLEYAVHEGMILYPVAQFIELALKDPRLQGRYEEKARSYLRLIEERVLQKQERHWLGRGARHGGLPVHRVPVRALSQPRPAPQPVPGAGAGLAGAQGRLGESPVPGARHPDGPPTSGTTSTRRETPGPGTTGTGPRPGGRTTAGPRTPATGRST